MGSLSGYTYLNTMLKAVELHPNRMSVWPIPDIITTKCTFQQDQSHLPARVRDLAARLANYRAQRSQRRRARTSTVGKRDLSGVYRAGRGLTIDANNFSHTLFVFDVWSKSGVLGLDVGVVGAVAEKSGSQQKRSSRGGLWSGL
jgi:hypothetical protein